MQTKPIQTATIPWRAIVAAAKIAQSRKSQEWISAPIIETDINGASYVVGTNGHAIVRLSIDVTGINRVTLLGWPKAFKSTATTGVLKVEGDEWSYACGGTTVSGRALRIDRSMLEHWPNVPPSGDVAQYDWKLLDLIGDAIDTFTGKPAKVRQYRIAHNGLAVAAVTGLPDGIESALMPWNDKDAK